MLLALFAVLSSKRTKYAPILYFRTVFMPWTITRSRKQPIFGTKIEIYFEAQFKYILQFFAPLKPAAPTRTCTREGARQGWNLESMLSTLLKQRSILLQSTWFTRLIIRHKFICGESCFDSRPGTFQAEYSSTRQNADNEQFPFHEGNGAERDTPRYP